MFNNTAKPSSTCALVRLLVSDQNSLLESFATTAVHVVPGILLTDTPSSRVSGYKLLVSFLFDLPESILTLATHM